MSSACETDELLPCPFCGNGAELLEAGRRAEAFIAGFDDDNKSDDVAGILRDLRAAIAKATGAAS